MPGFEDKKEWNYIRYRVIDPSVCGEEYGLQDIGDGVKRVACKKPDGKWITQALRFDKDKWDVEKAKVWVGKHDFEVEMYSMCEDAPTEIIKGNICKLEYGIEPKGNPPEDGVLMREIFATGTWNGHKYTEKDLEDMVTAFSKLKDRVKPVLKIGHKEQHKEFPNAGIIDSLQKVGDKLIATFKNVPKAIRKIIDEQGFNKVSSEIIWNWKDEESNQTYPRVLSAVALLGVTHPAVTNLTDWVKLYNSDSLFTHTFSIENGNFVEEKIIKQEEHEMDEKALKELQDKISTYEKEITELKKVSAENDANKAKIAEFEKQVVEHQKEVKKVSVEKFISDKKTEGKVLPAQEAMLHSVLMNASETQKFEFEIAKDKKEEVNLFSMICKLIDALPKVALLKEYSFDDKGEPIKTGTKPDGTTANSFKLDEMAKAYQKANANVGYADALAVISKEHPELCVADGRDSK